MLNTLSLSKIHPPQPRQLLSRPHLLKQLERCRQYPLTLISANTGFGKTSVLADFIRTSPLVCVWYSLDEGDRDPAIFCRYLQQAITTVYPTFGQSFQQLLEQNLTELHQEVILDRLADEFTADLGLLQQSSASETLIVLDDFQFAESTGVNRFVQRLVWRLPNSFHLLLATRSLPQDFPLTKLKAKQLVMTLEPDDLAFNVAEVSQLLREFYDIDEPELAAKLTDYSEGWITAVILALSNQLHTRQTNWHNLKLMANNGSQNDELFNYLVQEVFQNQPVELQAFLLKTSVLSLLNPIACDVLLAVSEDATNSYKVTAETFPGSHSESLLKQLDARNLFVMRLSSEGQTYFQYHSLFRQFLRSTLKQNKPLYRRIQLAAAEIEKEAANYVEAVQHYIEAGEITPAAALLNEIVEPLYQAGRTSLLANLLENIPAQAQSSLAHILNIKARLLLEKGQNEAALQTYALAEQRYLQEQAYERAAATAANQAQIMLRIDQLQEAQQICLRILGKAALLMQTLDGQKTVALTKQVLGLVAVEEGNSTQAEQNLREAAEIAKACQDAFRLATIDTCFGHFYYHAGRLVKSNIFFERALSYFVKVGNRNREAYCRTSLAIGSYLQGRYRAAEEQLNEALILAQDLNDPFLRLYVMACLGNIFRETERYTKADISYIEALELARQERVRKVELALLNDQATSCVVQNKNEEAHNLIRLSLELAAEYQLPEGAAASYRNQGWLEMASHSYKRALASFEKALAIFTSYQTRLEEVRTKLNLAIALFAVGESVQALTTLTHVIELTEELGFEPFLPFEVKAAAPLFEYATRSVSNEAVVEFLQRQGFTANLESTQKQAVAAELPLELKTSVSLNVAKLGLHVWALNGARVWKDDIEIEGWGVNKAREALFYLLEHPKCTRDELVDALWPEAELEGGISLLHNTLSHLRKALASTNLKIKLQAGRYFIEGPLWYDATEFSNIVQTALTTPELEAERLQQALNLYCRDFLDQFYSNWVVERQQYFLQLYLKGLRKLASWYETHQQFEAALAVWQQLLRKDPYDEEAYRATINHLLASGNKVEALRQFDRCCKALEELDLQPSQETALLVQNLA